MCPLRLGTLPPEHNWGSVVKEEGDGCQETTTAVCPDPEGFHGPHFKPMVAKHHLGYIRSIQGALKSAKGLDFND